MFNGVSFTSVLYHHRQHISAMKSMSSQFNHGPFFSRRDWSWGGESFDFCVNRESFHKPVWLTGIFYSINPLNYSERIKEVPPDQEDRPS